MTMAELEERALFQLADVQDIDALSKALGEKPADGELQQGELDVTSISLGILPLFDFTNLPLQYVDREKAFLEWYRANRYQCIVI